MRDEYRSLLSAELACVHIPACLLSCDVSCEVPHHLLEISKYYDNIINSIKKSVDAIVPKHAIRVITRTSKNHRNYQNLHYKLTGITPH